MSYVQLLKHMFWLVPIVIIVTSMTKTPSYSAPLSNSTSEDLQSIPMELKLSKFNRDQVHRILIAIITSKFPPQKYIFTTTIISKSPTSISQSPHILHQELRETIAISLLQYLDHHTTDKHEISIELIPTQYPLQSSYYLIIVFSHKTLTSEISEFLALESIQHLFYFITEPTIKRVTNIKVDESWTVIDDASEFNARRLLSRQQSQTSQIPPHLGQRAETWTGSPLLDGYGTPSENSVRASQFDTQVMAAQVAVYLERLRQSQSLHHPSQLSMDPVASVAGSMDRDSDYDIDYNASGMTPPQTVLHVPPQRPAADFDEFGEALPLGRTRKRSVTFVGESAESDTQTRSRSNSGGLFTMVGDRNAECQRYIQWLFFCWMIIAMLVTTNIVTCVFACWARKNATSLTDKAFTLALAIKDHNKILQQTLDSKQDHEHSIKAQHDENVHYQRESISVNTEAAKSYNGNHGNHNSVPLQRAHRNNTYHASVNNNINRKPQILQLPLCSPIPSTYSKSYSYAPPLAALKSSPSGVSRQASQPLCSLSTYHRLSPSDNQMRPYLNNQNNQNNVFHIENIGDSQSNKLDNHREEDDEKQDVLNNSPQNSNKESSDSSLMYQNDPQNIDNGNVPGSGTTKGKVKDGESSVYSPSSKSKRKRESPSK